MHPAILYERQPAGHVLCRLCPHACQLTPGQVGRCRVRHNAAGELVTSTYGRLVVAAVEPIEKKYLFHAFPGSRTLSVGSAGCSLGCRYCINWRISQRGVDDRDLDVAPGDLVAKALAAGASCIAFTYNEPAMLIEYIIDVARLARAHGLHVVAKSNGFMTAEAVQALAPWLDAINVDLKGWSDTDHRAVTGGQPAPVLAALRAIRQLGLWLEVSTLVVPGLNISAPCLEAMAEFIAAELGRDTPWHLLRFFPSFQLLDRPAPSQDQLRRAAAAAWRSGLKHVYVKDLDQGRMLHTHCAQCGTVLLVRSGYRLSAHALVHGCCRICHQPLAGVGLDLRMHSEVPSSGVTS
jgi:pyruvate formate lyase activating enzyme